MNWSKKKILLLFFFSLLPQTFFKFSLDIGENLCIIVLVNGKEMIPSAIFSDDEKYERHLRDTISMLEVIVTKGEDMFVESPMATRILLDFYQEVLRRHLIYGKSKDKK